MPGNARMREASVAAAVSASEMPVSLRKAMSVTRSGTVSYPLRIRRTKGGRNSTSSKR